MKRVLLALVATVVALVALLSFKSHHPSLPSNAGLPAAALGPTSAGAASVAPTASSAAPPEPSAGTQSPAKASRTTLGSAIDTRYGVVQVQVVSVGATITSVSFVKLSSDDGRSAQINSQAAPVLLQETLAAQSSDIDAVSGATYTSHGYVQSLQSALDQIGLR